MIKLARKVRDTFVVALKLSNLKGGLPYRT